MASVHEQTNKTGTTYRVFWRPDIGKQRSLSFADRPSADRFKTNIDTLGPTAALAILEAEDAGHGTTVAEWVDDYIGQLTGSQPATISRYRTYLANDITPHIGHLPLTGLGERGIAAWVTALISQTDENGETIPVARKTLQNKHAFLSGALKAAVRAGAIPSNPCEGRKLPETAVAEMVFLTPAEFKLVHDRLPHPRWQAVATWLVLTGMRFSEATALTPADIDLVAKTARVHRAWKYSGDYKPKLGPPKTRKGVRTVAVPDAALAVLDMTKPEYLFTNGVGNPLRAQEYFQAWKPARDRAVEHDGLTKKPRVHDLRHTCASWMIHANVPLPIIQQQLGHESIKTTVDRYGHLDTRNQQSAAMALDAAYISSTAEQIAR